MKILVTKKLSRSHPLFGAILSLLLFLFLALISNTLYLHTKLSFVPSELMQKVFGDEESFVEPMLYEEILGYLHFEIFFFALLYLLVLFLYFRINPHIKALSIGLFVALQLFFIFFALLPMHTFFSYLFVASYSIGASLFLLLFF